MTTKDYLSQIAILERKIKIQKSDIEMLRELSYSPSIKMDGERVQSSGNYDPMASTIAKIDEEEIKLACMIDKYMQVRDIIKRQIENIDNQLYSDILYEKYIICDSFNKMINVIPYSRRSLIKYHGYALVEFEKMYGDNYIDYISQKSAPHCTLGV